MSNRETSYWLESFRQTENLRGGDDGKTVCITGGKGGVGKTSIALKLSMELAHHGRRVLLVDCDHNLSNTAIKLGLPLNDHFSKLLKGEMDFEEVLYKRDHFHLLSGCNGDFALFEEGHQFKDYFLELIARQKSRYDYIILDSPAGVTDQTVFFASYCDERVFILNPDPSSLTDAYSLIKIIRHKFGIKENFLIVNKVQDRRQFDRVIKTVSETAENYLSVRSHVLGAIAFQSLEHESFDQFFLSRKKNLFNKNFIMILRKFLEKSDDGRLLRKNFLQHHPQPLG